MQNRFRQSKASSIQNKKKSEITSRQTTFGGAGAWLSGVTIGITFLSITFFAAGKAYRTAYLNEFGVFDSILPWSTQDLIYFGAVTQLSSLMSGFLWFFLFLAFLIAVIWGGYWLGKYLAQKKKAANRKRLLKDPNAPYFETAFLLLLALTMYTLFLMSTLSLIYIASAEKLGKEKGKTHLEAIISDDEELIQKERLQLAIFTKKESTKNSAGYLISCSDKACFGVLKAESIDDTSNPNNNAIAIEYIPLDQILQFSVPKKPS